VEREQWVTWVEEVLLRAGHPRSSARPTVVAALAEANRPLTVQELEQLIRLRRRVGRATIYHALELLCRHRLAHRIEFSDRQARYLAADDAAGHFLLCRDCGALIAVTLPALEQAIADAAERLGVAIEPRPLVLHGTCAECRKPASPAAIPPPRRMRRPSTRTEAIGRD
jgi:Fe2+ or Zn2+ uptake regulation protein